MRTSFYITMSAIGIVTFWVAVSHGSRGRAWIWVIPILVSPVGMLLVRFVWEYNWRSPHTQPGGMFNPSTQSWAFLYGDTLVLPLMMGVSAVAWRSIPQDSFYRSIWWILIAAMFGVAFMCLFHFVLEVPGYTEAGHAAGLTSPTKLWHDFTVYGSLSGALVYLSVPALTEDFARTGLVALVCFVAWAVLGNVYDGAVRDLKPQDLHPSVENTALR